VRRCALCVVRCALCGIYLAFRVRWPDGLCARDISPILVPARKRVPRSRGPSRSPLRGEPLQRSKQAGRPSVRLAQSTAPMAPPVFPRFAPAALIGPRGPGTRLRARGVYWVHRQPKARGRGPRHAPTISSPGREARKNGSYGRNALLCQTRIFSVRPFRALQRLTPQGGRGCVGACLGPLRRAPRRMKIILLVHLVAQVCNRAPATTWRLPASRAGNEDQARSAQRSLAELALGLARRSSNEARIGSAATRAYVPSRSPV